MSDNCQLIVFSNKAYNAIIRESFDKDPVETGGILLGHVLDNGVWIVMEVLPPGINSIFQYAYFEYDEAFVNYLAQSVANQYKRPLDLLGLWHRHPGNIDIFSTTDDGTNLTFARQNPAGVISGLVNIDPCFRLTMYHLDCPTHRSIGRPDYSVVEIEVGDDIIPEEYFKLRYFDGEETSLHPMLNARGHERMVNRDLHNHYQKEFDSVAEDTGPTEVPPELNINLNISQVMPSYANPHNTIQKAINYFFPFKRGSNKK
ncbi:MAG: Mov34/MPN/PAD-1 family protein [Muribaculaceae bacterium]|nr:Mov34/MPN/PAD-1 family protein [Muribaculaceae bacterium]